MTSATTATAPRKPANRRRGASRGRVGQPGGAHAIPWDEDRVILARIGVGMEAWLAQRRPQECLDQVNAWLAEHLPAEPAVSLTTIYEDRRRALELRRRHGGELGQLAVEQHIAELEEAQREAWARLSRTKDGSQNVTGLVNAIASIVERKAKLDGSLTERRQITTEVTLAGEGQAPALTNEDLAKGCAVLYQHSEEFRAAFDAELGRTVIDATPKLAVLARPQRSSNEGGVVPFVP